MGEINILSMCHIFVFLRGLWGHSLLNVPTSKNVQEEQATVPKTTLQSGLLCHKTLSFSFTPALPQQVKDTVQLDYRNIIRPETFQA